MAELMVESAPIPAIPRTKLTTFAACCDAISMDIGNPPRTSLESLSVNLYSAELIVRGQPKPLLHRDPHCQMCEPVVAPVARHVAILARPTMRPRKSLRKRKYTRIIGPGECTIYTLPHRASAAIETLRRCTTFGHVRPPYGFMQRNNSARDTTAAQRIGLEIPIILDQFPPALGVAKHTAALSRHIRVFDERRDLHVVVVRQSVCDPVDSAGTLIKSGELTPIIVDALIYVLDAGDRRVVVHGCCIARGLRGSTSHCKTHADEQKRRMA